MNLKTLLDEVIERGEKIKDEVLAEIVKSKKIKEIVSNQHFLHALTRVISTKDEVKRVLNKQVKTVFDLMDVPTQMELKNIASKLRKLEAFIDKLGSHKISVKALTQNKTHRAKSQTTRVAPKMKSTSKPRTKKTVKRIITSQRKTVKNKSARKK